MSTTLRVHKVPNSAEAIQNGVAWVSQNSRTHMAGQHVTILGVPFQIKTTAYLTAGEVALNAATRHQLHLDIGTSVDLVPQ